MVIGFDTSFTQDSGRETVEVIQRQKIVIE